MTDPLAEVVTLLHPEARFAKHIVGAGRWQSRRSDVGQPFYCVVLEGGCCITLDDGAPTILEEGDFALIPAAFGVTVSSLEPPDTIGNAVPMAIGEGLYRIGEQEGETDVRILAGHCSFRSPDATLLVSLLPELVHVRGETRLALLVKLLNEESLQQRPARDVVLSHLLEVLLIEALRSTGGAAASPGLVRGLADSRLAAAIRAMHAEPTRAWTVADLAKESALSRSSFFERFQRLIGVPPMEYLLAWRMALAKNMLRQNMATVASIAEQVGYGSPSTFSAAFSRHVGRTPSQFANDHAMTSE